MFESILIANRGEIACRIIRTVREMGVRSVAVYSDVDAGALHVAMADMSICLGGASPAESYLRGEAIIEAALKSGAQAIHPGYGFLSENPEFAEAVLAAGLVFIGPSVEAIRAMGLKDAAKRRMLEAGVPVVPGYLGEDQTAERLRLEAGRIGYPVLIKAVAGGGGKGMRLVLREEEFDEALVRARAEALGAFGNETVLIEKYVQSPRHIEIQVFGDGCHAVHLFERDCSLQRRHQKVIEEAPAPGMTDEMRLAMGEAAVRAAEAIGYKGAGTVEFIVDGSEGLRADRFWFMEMNTRLQVEHPVSEAVTGVDLVEWQIRVAAGEALPCAQEDLVLTGHAFEARLYAEDVPAGFLPATGRLAHLAFPEGLRIESGVRSGDEISPHYDPMIAKVIAHGASREEALLRLRRGLEASEVAGTVTNIAFLGALCRHEGFVAGVVDTGLIARDLEELTVCSVPSERDWIQAGMMALGLDREGAPHHGFALWGALTRRVRLRHGEEEREFGLRCLGADLVEGEFEGSRHRICRKAGRWCCEDIPLRAGFAGGGSVYLFGAQVDRFDLVDPMSTQTGPAAGADVTLAPMPGRVVSVDITAGQQVREGERLLVLEAMKMEHGLCAARDGIITEILVSEGEQVTHGAALVRLGSVEEET